MDERRILQEIADHPGITIGDLIEKMTGKKPEEMQPGDNDPPPIELLAMAMVYLSSSVKGALEMSRRLTKEMSILSARVQTLENLLAVKNDG